MRSLASLIILAASTAVAAPKAAPVKITYDEQHLDLEKHELQFKYARPAKTAELTVTGEDGSELATANATYDKPSVNDWLSITWTPKATTSVMKLELRVVSTDNQVTILSLIPWSVSVAPEDVTFATDSSAIGDSEAKKLDASLTAITDAAKNAEKFMKLRLYVAGHTDTVGAGDKNKKLSLDRARAIATYFRAHGLTTPIAFAGFGEDVLKVRTADNTDEARNRRADYVLGPADSAPPFKGAYLKAKADWKQLAPAK
ncbi:hypothetical protein BH11MYX2_BH11MYX2_00430 [soil metagenome]